MKYTGNVPEGQACFNTQAHNDEKHPLGTSLPVQWLRRSASSTGGTGSIPGGGTKIPHPTWLQAEPKYFFK